eukprot:GEMP01018130.1.p2 GENE.GEMP01018130.1~~GEMP01018130.1.p2  ORF type:complete len:402 (+),score=143.50 GEMP01018130.1:83-1288(+)
MPDITVHSCAAESVLLASCRNVNDIKVKIAMLDESLLAPGVSVVDAMGLEFEHDYVVPPAEVTVMLHDLTYDADLYRQAFMMHASAVDTAGCDRAMAAFLAHPVPVVEIPSPRLDRPTSGDSPAVAEVVDDPIEASFRLAGSALIHYVDRFGAQSREDVVELFLAIGADVQYKNKEQHSILMRAIEYNCVGIVRLVLDATASVHDTDREDRMPLDWAACGGHGDVALMLLDAGAAVDAKEKYQRTPLYGAAMNGRDEVVQLLLDASADVDDKDIEDSTALHVAAMYGHSSVVRVLLEAESELGEIDVEHNTPFNYAVMLGHGEVVRLLLDAQVSAQDTHRHERTALHMAAMYGHAAVVRVLLDARADAEKECSRQWTPLCWATERGHSETARMLASHAEGG